MKIKFFVFILMIFMVISFSSCEKDLSKMNEEQIINTLKKEFMKQYVKDEYPFANKSRIIHSKYYGEYNNAYIMEFYVKGFLYTTDLPEEEIEGYKFWFAYTDPLVYKDGTFYGFRQAYNIGILTIEDIADLYYHMYGYY